MKIMPIYTVNMNSNSNFTKLQRNQSSTNVIQTQNTSLSDETNLMPQAIKSDNLSLINFAGLKFILNM